MSTATLKDAEVITQGELEDGKQRPYPGNRLTVAAITQGELLHLCLPGDEVIEAGPQDVERFASVGPALAMGQWIQVTNDAASFFRLMRVEAIHGGRGLGLRALILRDIAPPYVADKADEPIQATGEFYVRWGGAHRKWMVIAPNGSVRKEGFGSESEARNVRDLDSRNAGSLR